MERSAPIDSVTSTFMNVKVSGMKGFLRRLWDVINGKDYLDGDIEWRELTQEERKYMEGNRYRGPFHSPPPGHEEWRER